MIFVIIVYQAANSPTVIPQTYTVTVTNVTTWVTVSNVTEAPQIYETIVYVPDCAHLYGSCTDMSRQLEEGLSNCSVYGRNDPRCHEECNSTWTEELRSKCSF